MQRTTYRRNGRALPLTYYQEERPLDYFRRKERELTLSYVRERRALPLSYISGRKHGNCHFLISGEKENHLLTTYVTTYL